MRTPQSMLYLALATSVVLFAMPHQAAADEQVRAYVLFELADPGTDAAVETLRSSSLGNCKQIPLERSAYNEVILHLDCYEPDQSNEYLSQAVMQLAATSGVSRATVIELAAGLSIPCREADIDLYDAYNADEVFLTSTSLCICPVRSINGSPIADGSVPGPTTRRLSDAYIQRVQCDFVAQYLRHLEG